MRLLPPHCDFANGVGSIVEQDSRLVPLSFSPPEIFHFSLCWRQEQILSKANAAFVRKTAEMGVSLVEVVKKDAIVERHEKRALVIASVKAVGKYVGIPVLIFIGGWLTSRC